MKSEYPLISLISNECLNKINSMFGTSYTKQIIKNQIKIQRKEQGFGYLRNLMQTIPGFEKRTNE